MAITQTSRMWKNIQLTLIKISTDYIPSLLPMVRPPKIHQLPKIHPCSVWPSNRNLPGSSAWPNDWIMLISKTQPAKHRKKDFCKKRNEKKLVRNYKSSFRANEPAFFKDQNQPSICDNLLEAESFCFCSITLQSML